MSEILRCFFPGFQKNCIHLKISESAHVELAIRGRALPAKTPCTGGNEGGNLSFGLAKGLLTPDDETLVRLVCLGEKEKFTELVRRHERIVYSIVHGMLNSPADSEEVLQESFLKAYTHLGDFRGQAQFRTWLIRIAINEAKMRLRKYRPGRFDSIDEEGPDGEPAGSHGLRDWSPNPEELMGDLEMAGLLERAVRALPRGYREVFLLRDVQHLSTEAAAEALEISIPAAKTRLRRARLMMREYLAPHFQKRSHPALPDEVGAGRGRS